MENCSEFKGKIDEKQGFPNVSFGNIVYAGKATSWTTPEFGVRDVLRKYFIIKNYFNKLHNFDYILHCILVIMKMGTYPFCAIWKWGGYFEDDE